MWKEKAADVIVRAPKGKRDRIPQQVISNDSTGKPPGLMHRNCIAMYGLGGLDDLRWPDMNMQVTEGAYVYVHVGVLPGGYNNG